MTTPAEVFAARWEAGKRHYRKVDNVPAAEWSGTTSNAAYIEWEEHARNGIRDLARVTGDPLIVWMAAQYASYGGKHWAAARLLLQWDYITQCGRGSEFLLRLTEVADEQGWCDGFLMAWEDAQVVGVLPKDADPVEIFVAAHGQCPSFSPDYSEMDD